MLAIHDELTEYIDNCLRQTRFKHTRTPVARLIHRVVHWFNYTFGPYVALH